MPLRLCLMGVVCTLGAVAEAQPNDPTHAGLGEPKQQLSTQQATAELAAGTIEILVQSTELPVANQKIELAVMKRDSSRDSKTTTTDDSGKAVFSGLGTGTAQAYRVNLLHDGAKTSSTPFRLDDGKGMRVTLVRLPVSEDSRFIVNRLARIGLGLREGRIRVTEQMVVMNLSSAIYSFPEEGLLVDLPKEHLSFRSEKTMSDQRVVEQPDGLRVFGSLAPGQATLLWDFDMPVEQSEFKVSLKMPFPTMNFSVEADGAPGATLAVEGFAHETVAHEDRGRNFLIAQHRQVPGKGELIDTVNITYAGLPGPGPARWFAVALAGSFILLGLWLGSRRRTKDEADKSQASADELLAEAKALEAEKENGEVGPEYYAKRRRQLTDALANALRHQDTSG